MRKKFTIVLWLSFILGWTQNTHAQNNVIIGDTMAPKPDALLQLESTTQGILIPRVALTATNVAAPVSSPTTSLMVYNTATAGSVPTNVTPGFYYWGGSSWIRFFTGILGQSSATVYGSAALSVTNPTITFTLIPGLTQTVIVPVNAVVNIATDGGVATTSASTTGYSGIDIAIYIDGVIVPNGGYKRIYVLNNGGLVNNFGFWSMSLSSTLSAGSHTIAVRSAYTAGSTATVSGNNSSVLQGALTVTVLKQ